MDMLTEHQIERLEQRLVEEREAARRHVREAESPARPDGPADATATDGSRAPATRHDRVERTVLRLDWIDDALRRLRADPEAFDRSEVSGLTIPFARLYAEPWTRVLAGEADVRLAPGAATPDDRADDEDRVDDRTSGEGVPASIRRTES